MLNISSHTGSVTTSFLNNGSAPFPCPQGSCTPADDDGWCQVVVVGGGVIAIFRDWQRFIVALYLLRKILDQFRNYIYTITDFVQNFFHVINRYPIWATIGAY